MFWDFDGVIKETVSLKGEAFAELFKDHGQELVTKIRKHHASHGGVSRLEKIPLYLGWAGLAQDSENIRLFCERYSEMVLKKVIEAPWVPGAKEFLRHNPFQQKFYLVTATPQPEIEAILAALGLGLIFAEVLGAPVKKADAIRKVLAVSQIQKEKCLFIGDSLSDKQAAAAVNIPFLFRKNKSNKFDLQKNIIRDFLFIFNQKISDKN